MYWYLNAARRASRSSVALSARARKFWYFSSANFRRERADSTSGSSTSSRRGSSIRGDRGKDRQVAVDRPSERHQLGFEILCFLAQRGDLRRLLRQRTDTVPRRDHARVTIRIDSLLLGKALLHVGQIPEPLHRPARSSLVAWRPAARSTVPPPDPAGLSPLIGAGGRRLRRRRSPPSFGPRDPPQFVRRLLRLGAPGGGVGFKDGVHLGNCGHVGDVSRLDIPLLAPPRPAGTPCGRPAS